MVLGAIIEETRPRIDTIIGESFPDSPDALGSFQDLIKAELAAFRNDNLYLVPVLVGNVFGNSKPLFLYLGSFFELVVEALGFLDNLPSLYRVTDTDKTGSLERTQDAMKLLASDALIPLSFQILAADGIWEEFPEATAIKSLQKLMYAISSHGALPGLLMQSTLQKFKTLKDIESVSGMKTGNLFGSVALICAQLCGASDQDQAIVQRAGETLGTCYPAVRFLNITRNVIDTSRYRTFLECFSAIDRTELKDWLLGHRDTAVQSLKQLEHKERNLFIEYCNGLLARDE